MIPAKLMIHTVTVRTPTGMDEDRNPTFEEEEISGVRIGTSYGWQNGTNGKTPSDRVTLSTNPDFIPSTEMRIVFDGREYSVKTVSPKYTDVNTVHHYEAELV